jgi:hypothetical protein
MDDLINRANLPSVLNGVTMSECDKVIEPFLEERSCDEVWHTVRALRDFYDWVMSENAVEPKQGEWINGGSTNGSYYKRCNQCFAVIDETFFADDFDVNFCPNCGAKMKGADDD